MSLLMRTKLALRQQEQHGLCHNSEGWGPLSSIVYDFTPCFWEIPQLAVAAFGIIACCYSIWHLSKSSKQATPKDWHYFSKLILVFLIGLATITEGYIQIIHPDLPVSYILDVRFWTKSLQIISIAFAFATHEFEHERSRVASGSLLFFWLFSIPVSALYARSLLLRRDGNHNELFVVGAFNTILVTIVLILELLVPKQQSKYRQVGINNESPYEYSSIFSRLLFSWFTPLIKYGSKVTLGEDDLWDLPTRNTSKANGDKLTKSWKAQANKAQPSLWKALFSGFGQTYMIYVPLKLVADLLSYSQPQLLRILIDFVESFQSPIPAPAIKGVLIACAMLFVSSIQSMLNNVFMNNVFELGQTVRAGLVANIYKKSLRLSHEGLAGKSTGDVVNLMAVDSQRIADLSRQGFQLWACPFQIALCMLSLWNLLGWVGLAGCIVLCFMVPLNSFLSRLMKKYQRLQMKNKDERTRTTTEILNNMKSIKLYSWTSAFSDKLAHIRNDKELVMLRKMAAAQAAFRFCWGITPFLVSCATFSLFVLINDKPLSVELVFPALTLFNLLTQPLNQLPNVISSLIESTVAIQRIQSFLLAREVQSDAVSHRPRIIEPGQESVRIHNATFSWHYDGSYKALSNINFNAKTGELSCIVGRVGSGKSSMLQAILGDMHKLSGTVTTCGTVAYVPQNPWIINASVQDNILFGQRWDSARYQRTIRACALIEDIAILPDKDLTEVGEKGISLSGGQKARVQLARAVYANADIYLLDDVLSAVDHHVGRHIIDNVIGPRGLLRAKTVVLATNSVPVLKHAAIIALVDDGEIKEQGTYLEAMNKNAGIAYLLKTVKDRHTQAEWATSPTSVSSSATMTNSRAESEDEASDKLLDKEQDLSSSIDERERISFSSEGSFTKNRNQKHYHSTKGRTHSMSKAGNEDEELALIPITRQAKEKSAKGKVKWNVYHQYAQACNVNAIGVWLFAILSVQALQVGSSVWLKNWSELNDKTGTNPDVLKNIGVYFALGASSATMIFVQTMIMWNFCSIQASKKLHEDMAHAIFRSPMSFFETTPIGRILNRFSSDMFRVDEAVGKSFGEFFSSLAKAVFTLGVICFTTPVFTLVLVPLGTLYLFIQRYYLRSSRELKRLESVSRSPTYAHFAESLSGAATIRAYRQQKRWGEENETRMDANMRAWFPAIHANRWLTIRLEFIGALVVFLSALLSIVAVVKGNGPSAGMVGLTMSYALNITQVLNWLVRLSVEVETNIVSVERVLEYSSLKSEAADVLPHNGPSPQWPSQGEIQFEDFSMRYRPGLDLALRNISLSIRAREKIGVVGRTGAGKSSLTLSLFRIVEADEGTILIDGLDTSFIGLADLRSKLAIIPQDAALFEGTIRDNLDPCHVKSDDELWLALEHARLKDHVSGMSGGLDAAIHEGGSNLSQGQKQLVSLARALLTNSSVLVLDEATAAVDVETDTLLQETLRSDLFRDRTIITIAHRINTIADCDKIVVLSKGEIVEFGTPQQLIQDGGHYYSLALEAGLTDEKPVL